MQDEIFDILDDSLNVIGTATREECHNGSFLLHSVVHVLVFNSSDELLLQKRSQSKIIQPGKWDTSVGGHISTGESLDIALERETEEELGIKSAIFEKLYSYVMVSEVEREYVNTFRCLWDKPLQYQESEIDEIRFFSQAGVESHLDTGFFTPNFEDEWRYYQEWKKNVTK